MTYSVTLYNSKNRTVTLSTLNMLKGLKPGKIVLKKNRP